MNGLRLGLGCLRPFPVALQCNLQPRVGSLNLFTCRRLNRQSSSSLPPRLGRSCRPCLRIQASLGDKWTPPEEINRLINEIYKRVQPMANSLISTIQTALKLQRQWVQQAWARSLLAWAIALGLVTAISNAWGVPAVNHKLPQLAQQAAAVLQRDVQIGRIHWIAPTGVTGLHPLASVGPISVGAGPVEGSNATLERVLLGFNPIQSICRGRLVLTMKVGGAEVHLKQADNFSWFGFPDDTTPSSRDFVPGLNENPKSKNGKGGRGAGGGGGSAAGGGSNNAPIPSNSPLSSRRSRNTARKAAATKAASTRATPAPTSTISSRSSPSDNVIASIAQEFLAWHAAHDKAAQDSITMANPTTSSGGTSFSSSSLESDEHPVVAAETLVLLSTTNSYPSLASMSVSSAPSTSPLPSPPSTSSSSSSSHNGNTSTSAAATSRTSTSGWRSLLPFQSNSEKERKKSVDARKQQLDKLNSIRFSVAGGSGISTSSKDTRSSIEGSKLPVEEAPAAAVAPLEKIEKSDNIPFETSSSADTDARSDITKTAATPLDDLDISSVSTDSTTTTSVRAADGSLVERENEEMLTLHSGQSGFKEATAGPPETRPMMTSTRAASVLNSLPTLRIDIRSSSNIAAQEKEEGENSQREPPVESSAVKSINSLGEIAKGRRAPPVEKLQKDPKLAHFKEIVLDQATVRKKALGSKALQEARNWLPAKTAAAPAPTSTLSPDSIAINTKDFNYSTSTATKLAGEADGLSSSPSSGLTGGASETLDGYGDPELSEHHKNHGNHHKYNITHPGYFPPSPGPVYTPAPPEALAELRAKRRTLGTLVQSALKAAGALVQRSLVVSTIELNGGTLYGHIYGEELPRVFENVTATVKLGANYDTLAVDINALPHARNPESLKCTMLHPYAHRHLREWTGVEALQAQEDLAAAASAAEGEEQTPSTCTTHQKNNSTTPTNPNGGKVRVLVNVSGIVDNQLATGGARVPLMTISVQGQNLHAPLVERIFELPMDVNDGRANGEFIIKMHDLATWHAPEYHGRVAVRGANFHFWDATDDIIDADLDLLFEGDRLYLHNAKGKFGAVPMRLTGDLDLDPLTGQYRLSATVPGVEINALRATLGVRPTPFPVVGSVAGTLHVTGPLEKPIFSGTARVGRPSLHDIQDCEPTNALETLLSEPTAVGAYDKVPVASAELVFTLDTSKEQMTLHEFKASPVGGGELHGSGSLGVSPASETDPNALQITAYGNGLPAESLARRYLPEGSQMPPGIIVGPGSVTATMSGAHLAPVINVGFSLPEGSVSGSVQFTREATSISVASPNLDGSGTVFIRPPSYDAIKAAVTQQEATALAKPDISGGDADVMMRGLDIVPLLSDEESLRRLAQQSGEPLRLKINGRAKIAGTVATATNSTPSGEDTSPNSPNANSSSDPWQFAGSVDLEDLKLNQLKLYRALKGSLTLSNSHVAVHAKGIRPDEVLDVDLALPLFSDLVVEPVVESPVGSSTENNNSGDAVVAGKNEYVDVVGSDGEIISGQVEEGGGDSGITNASYLSSLAPPQRQSLTAPTQQPKQGKSGSSVSIRCGQLLAAATMDAAGSQLDVRVANVKLDELELASLRGELQEVSCSLNFQGQTGRGRLSLASPRYSGLRGDSLSGGFRWERDVVRLEKLVLQQRRSKYEVQGEYVVPPSIPLPTSAADLARRQAEQRKAAADGTAVNSLPVPGRWRLRVDVPTADMQEILPAARLLQSATSRRPADYERAKTAFISAVRSLSLKAEDLNGQLRELAEKLAAAADLQISSTTSPTTAVAAISSRNNSSTTASSSTVPAPFQMPSFQDVRGHWNGSIQAFGGGGGATSCEFDVRGTDWQWGQASLDTVVADGSYHSEEGVQIQEFVLKSGDAKLLVRGSLLSDHQDATVLLTDFPMTKLKPIFRAVPALKNAAPAVSGKVPDPVPSPMPLGMLANALGQASQGLQQASVGPDSDSPINGMLYLSGTLGGSKEAPSGEIAVRLFDAAVGPTRLAQAQASARLSEKMQLSFNVDVVPVEGHRKSGHIRASGSIPLASNEDNNTHINSTNSPSSLAAAAAAAAPGGSDTKFTALHSSTTTSPTSTTTTDPPLDVRISVRDSGMAVLTSMAPNFKWQSGEADVSLKLTGTVDQPTVTGGALINKAVIDCPVLKFPLEIVSADVRCADGMLEVETVDARVGRKGHLKIRGALPVYQSKQPQARGAAPVIAAMQHRLTVDVQGLELRVRNLYTGQMDALLTLRDSVERPVMGGSLRFSRGAVYLIPQGQEIGGTAAASGFPGTAGSPLSSGTSVAKVFDLLTRRESGLATRLEDAVRQEVEAVEHMVEDAAGPNMLLDSLAIQFGPDLRAVYPLVMNFGISGELITSGAPHPDAVSVEGVLRLPGGDVNLVAAQLELDREHDNTLTFGSGGVGVDPMVDVVLTSGDLRLSVRGRASEWADHLVMQNVGAGASGAGDAGEQLDATEAARILEAKLKATLLADDGQLALSRLAGSTVSTLMPKLETQGTVGGARWRLVSAPAIPGLLDPFLADPSNLLGSITMGTEAEVQFGRKLQATMVRKLADSDVNTQWTLNYLLNSKLRMQFNISSAAPYSKTLMFQYSSEGSS
ncbi:hypothetical protein Ndes2526B_g07937 [Nannochloris sp. 'desiccata']